MKEKRQKRIIDLIENNQIETQEELANLLIQDGFTVTQATVSRDIKELNLFKAPLKDGRQAYAVAKHIELETSAKEKYIRVLQDNIVSLDTAGNLLVIKTASGMGMAVGTAVDALEIKEIIGCVAGDDTVMCAVKNADRTEEVRFYLEHLKK